MVNAKLGSLARRIRGLHLLVGQKNWHEKVLSEIGEIYLLVKGFQNMEKLPPNLQQELLSVSGINFNWRNLDWFFLPGALRIPATANRKPGPVGFSQHQRSNPV